MNTYSDPAFVAAEMAYRYDRDHVTHVEQRRAERHGLARIWHRLTHPGA